MSADIVIGGVLVALALAWALAWLLARAAQLREPEPPARPERKFYQCQQRGCTARATRIVLLITAASEAIVVCDSDRDRLTITGRAVDLGPIFRGLA